MLDARIELWALQSEEIPPPTNVSSIATTRPWHIRQNCLVSNYTRANRTLWCMTITTIDKFTASCRAFCKIK